MEKISLSAIFFWCHRKIEGRGHWSTSAVEQIYSIQIFQDGGVTSVKGNFGKRDYLCKWDLEYHKLSGDDNVTNTGGNRVDIQKVSGYVVNAGNISKGLCKDIDVTIINSIGNSSCPTAYEVPSETDKSTAFVWIKIKQQIVSTSPLKGNYISRCST